MLTLFFIFVIFFIIHQQYGLSAISMGLAMSFGAVVAIFLGPVAGVCGAIAWAILSSNKSE